MPKINIQDSYRVALRRMATSVSIVTTANEQEKAGMTVSSVVSLSFDPLSLLVCIHKDSGFYNVINEQKKFCINLLDQNQTGISDKFSRPASEKNLFDNGTWLWHDGLPYLEGAQANFFLDIKQTHLFGTHGIFIGEVSDIFYANQVSPLVYLDGSYGIVTN